MHGMKIEDYEFYKDDAENEIGREVDMNSKAENFNGTEIYLKCNFF